MFRTLKRRLTGWYLLILACVVIGYGLANFLLARTVLQRSLDDTNHHALLPVVVAFAESPPSLVPVERVLADLPLDQGEHFALLHPDGSIRLQRGVVLATPPPVRPGAFTYAGDGIMRMLDVPLSHQGRIVGYLRAGHTLFDHLRILQGLATSLLVTVPLTLLVAWVGGWFLAGKSLVPLKAAFERERQLTRDASHELRTPLAVIQAHTELALAQAELPPSVQAKLQTILATTQKMNALVGDLLTLGRVDVGVGDVGLRFGLGEVVEDEVAALAPLAATRQVALRADLEAAGDTVLGDPGRIAQAVRNLIDNAIRYTPAGGRVDVGLQAKGGWVLLQVRDTGPGIAAGDRGRIFERFGRLDHGRAVNPEGSGLGLALCRAIAQAHGGDVMLEEPASGGASFTLRLPSSP